jgi:ribosomal protein S18 acetylase RimI-like enzyme
VAGSGGEPAGRGALGRSGGRRKVVAQGELRLVPVDVHDPELSQRFEAYWHDLGVVPLPSWHRRYMERLREDEGRDRHTFWGQLGSERVGLVQVRLQPDWLFPERRIGYIVEFTVFAPWRRRGLGRALYRLAREYLERQGCAYVELDVLPHNRVAMAFWRSLGFEVVYHHLRASP